MLSHPMGEMRILSKEAGNKQIRAVCDRGVGRRSVWPAEGGKIGAEHDIQPKERRAGCRAPKRKGQRQRTEGLETVQCPCIFNRQSAYAVSTGCLTTNHWQDKSVGDAISNPTQICQRYQRTLPFSPTIMRAIHSLPLINRKKKSEREGGHYDPSRTMQSATTTTMQQC